MKPKRIDIFTDQKRAQKEAARVIESKAFLAALPKSRWIK